MMSKNQRNQFFVSSSLICIIFIVSGVSGYDFTIEDFWEEGGVLYFEMDYEEDLPGSIADIESTFDGAYVYNGSTLEGNSVFNVTLTKRAQEFLLIEYSISLEPLFFFRVVYPFENGDELDYNFTVSNGAIDFFVFNMSQYNLWFEGNDTQSLQAINAVYTDGEASGTVFFSTSDYYYFIWYNDPKYNDNEITLQLRLDARIVEKSTREVIELNPTTLESTEGNKIDDFGIDTSDWVIDKEISIEIDERDVYFSIVREVDFTISYNNETVEIPCWILEVEDYRRTFIEEETYSINADISIWKSKFSGITLKSVIDIDFFDTNDTIFATTFDKFTVKSVDNVLLIPKSSRVIFPIIPTVIALLVLFRFKKKQK